jgi:hypothetical protein
MNGKFTMNVVFLPSKPGTIRVKLDKYDPLVLTRCKK